VSLFLLCLATYGAFAYHAPEAKPPLKVAVGVWPGSETLILGRETLRLDPRKIKLVEMAWSSAAMRAFSNDVVDAAVLTLDEVLRLRESGHDVHAVLVMDFSAGADAVLARKDIASVAGLRGKRIGAELQTAGIYLLARALETAGLTLSDVEIVPMNQAEMETAFVEGEVDAVTASEPWVARLRKTGVVSLFTSAATPQELCRVLAVRAGVLADRQESLKHLVKVHFASQADLLTGPPSPALGAVCRRLGLSLEDLRKEVSYLNTPTVEENRKLLSGDSPEFQNIVNKVQNNMIRNQLIRHDPPAGEWITAELLEGAQ